VYGLIRSLAPRRRGPAMLMRAVNDALVERKVDAQYVTLLVALWDGARRELIMANAGGTPPLICRRGEIIRPKVAGVPLGLFDHQEYEETVFTALPGDLILFCSDGVEDQPNAAGEHYGFKRLQKYLPKIVNLPAADLVKALEEDIDRFRDGGPVHDDQSMIVMKVR
jgi:phosphoserine phosphatase RsbU/P